LSHVNFPAVFAALLTTVLFSISAVCGHRSARLIGGTEANFWRAALATFFLAIWSYGFGQGLAGVALPYFLLSGLLGIGVGDVAFFQALPRLGPRLSVLLVHCLTAPLGALVEWLWLGTTLTWRQMLFGAITLVGVGIALTPGRNLRLTRRELAIGVAAGVLAALGGAGGAVYSRKAYAVLHATGEHLDAVNAGYQRMLAGVLVAGICLLLVKRREFRVQARAPQRLVAEVSLRKWRGVWHWILLNALAGQTLGVSCMQWAFETTPAGVVLSIIALSPIVVIPIALVVEGERPGIQSLIGGAVAVAGVIALTLSR
jgi:drug/metabolite transporter (DMT)-like permease